MPHDALFAELVDDAAIFPPSSLSVRDALDSHRLHRLGAYADALGAFVMTASRVNELRAATVPDDYLRLAIVGDTDLAELRNARAAVMDDPWIEVVALEVTLPAGLPADEATRIAIDELAFTVPASIEVPRTGFESALDVLAADGAERAKYRTGGQDQSAAPTSAELAAFIAGCAQRRVAFTLTGGLPHAVRGVEAASGLDLHGVLNVLVATDRAIAGAPIADVVVALEEHDASALVAGLDGISGQTREMFRSFGCNDVSALIDDLVALGVLSRD